MPPSLFHDPTITQWLAFYSLIKIEHTRLHDATVVYTDRVNLKWYEDIRRRYTHCFPWTMQDFDKWTRRSTVYKHYTARSLDIYSFVHCYNQHHRLLAFKQMAYVIDQPVEIYKSSIEFKIDNWTAGMYILCWKFACVLQFLLFVHK